MSTDIYNDSYDKKTTKLALYDTEFQNKLLNEENAFNVDENIKNKYFPQLNWPDCMPKQEYVQLPEVQDSDLPDIIYTEIIEQTSSSAKVKFRINNPSAETITSIKIKNVSNRILSQEYNDGQSMLIVELYDPIYFTSSYDVLSISTKGAFNKEYTREFKEGERRLNIDLYKEIRTIDEWNNINKSLSENYILMNDIDFINNGNKAKISGTFSGKIKGNDYALKNILISGGTIFSAISNISKIEDLNINNYQSIGNNAGGIIENLQGEINNIHVTNQIIEKTNESRDNNQGGLVNLNYGQIYNCSINNLEFKDSTYSVGTNIGGMVGNTIGGNIKNCYISNLNMDIKNNFSYSSIGGFIGKIESSNTSVSDCYITGKIETDGDVGGIVGIQNSGRVENCYTLLDISSQSSVIGGIIGKFYATTNVYAKNNIFLGNLYSTFGDDKVSTICSNTILKDNYTYENVKVNGIYIKDINNVLTLQDLINEKTYKELGFGTEFNYENIINREMPRLNQYNTSEILKNQNAVAIPERNDIYIENIEYEKTNINELMAIITLNNRNNKEIVNINIENITITSKNIISRDGKTYITVVGMPNKYYSSYKINEIIYLEQTTEKVVQTDGKINIKFYKELYNVADWQDIEIGTYQNYKLMNNIDFKNMSNIKYNVTMQELTTNNNQNYKLENIKLELDENSGLIKKVTTIENVTFENVDIYSEKATKNVGIIVANENINKCNFNNVKLVAENASFVGCINNNLNMENIEVNNLEIHAKDYVGGLIGKVTGSISNIECGNITVIGHDYVGGIVGYLSGSIHDLTNTGTISIEGNNNVGGIAGWTHSNNYNGAYNIEIENVTVKGNQSVGGIAGIGSVYKAKGKQFNISGTNYVGGIVGQIQNAQNYGNTIIDSIVIGNDYVGGILGTNRADADMQGHLVENVKIIGKNNVGGIAGEITFGRNTFRYSAVKNSNIEATGENVGGLVGYANVNIYYNYCQDTTVKGKSNVGGLVGKSEQKDIYCNYTNATVEGEDSVGGIIGFVNNKDMTEDIYIIRIYDNYVADSKISANSNLGGLIGKVYKVLSSGEYYYGNYIHVELNSPSNESTSLGVGSNKNSNLELKYTYYYKYSKINNENPNIQNEIFITQEKYLIGQDLRNQTTYLSKLKWNTSNWKFEVLENEKYPIINNTELPEQEGIYLPIDEDHIVNSSMNEVSTNSLENEYEVPEQIFEYNNKTIQTYSTYSLITAEDGTQATRNAKLYVKDNALYAIPSVVSANEDSEVIPVANNLIIDSYNGKEYETVLGSDGKIYDLKEPITYPEKFVNADIESIGNNLNSDVKEVEVIYKNGDKIKFNYQTGEIISSSEAEDAEKTGLFAYLKEKIAEIGETSANGVSQEITTKYEESKQLQTKLKETSVEEAIEKQNIAKSDEGTEGVTTTENNVTNNSLTENKYISMYNEETGQYEIYNEEELLDTSKEEVVSENEKIEANNLSEYYASEGETKNTKMGIVWIVISIIGVGIILFVLRKNLKKKNA